MKSTDVIRLPTVLDRHSVGEIRAHFDHAGPSDTVIVDGSHLARVDLTGVQLLCALVLACEGRGTSVIWLRVSMLLINCVKLLGISDILRFDDQPVRGVPT